jgi:3-oxoacyl-(acyl-carrier-protein) synthase
MLGDAAVPVSSTKHVFGHTLGAAGAVSAVVGVLAFREGFVPGNCAVAEADPACPVELVPPDGLARAIDSVLVNAMGFGGTNCALVLTRAGA